MYFLRLLVRSVELIASAWSWVLAVSDFSFVSRAFCDFGFLGDFLFFFGMAFSISLQVSLVLMRLREIFWVMSLILASFAVSLSIYVASCPKICGSECFPYFFHGACALG